MKSKSKVREFGRHAAFSACIVALLFNPVALPAQQAQSAAPLTTVEQEAQHQQTQSPIKHVIVLIGENRTFDHLFATYVAPSGDSVKNLLSEGIIKADGAPGRNFSRAQQSQALPPFKTSFYISLNAHDKTPYQTLPVPTLNDSPVHPFFPPGTSTSILQAVEPSLPVSDLNLLTTGTAPGITQTLETPDPDTRVANFNNLLNGPYPLRGANLPYDSYTGDTTHRLFEMWQQSDQHHGGDGDHDGDDRGGHR